MTLVERTGVTVGCHTFFPCKLQDTNNTYVITPVILTEGKYSFSSRPETKLIDRLTLKESVKIPTLLEDIFAFQFRCLRSEI